MTKRIPSVVLLSLLLLIPACQNSSPTTPLKPEVKVTSITVTSPSGKTFVVGATVMLTATATMSDGHRQRITSGTWSSSDSAVATVDSGGLATIVGVGTASISLSYSGKAGSLTLVGREAVFEGADLLGTWQATKAEAWRVVEVGGGFQEVEGSRRDLVAEGGTVTLVLEANGTYTITLTMPGAKPGVDTGRWIFNKYAMSSGVAEYPQIDFYPASLPPDFEYGDVPAFLVAPVGNTLKLWDSGLTFLPFDFGWNPDETVLSLVFARK